MSRKNNDSQQLIHYIEELEKQESAKRTKKYLTISSLALVLSASIFLLYLNYSNLLPRSEQLGSPNNGEIMRYASDRIVDNGREQHANHQSGEISEGFVNDPSFTLQQRKSVDQDITIHRTPSKDINKDSQDNVAESFNQAVPNERIEKVEDAEKRNLVQSLPNKARPSSSLMTSRQGNRAMHDLAPKTVPSNSTISTRGDSQEQNKNWLGLDVVEIADEMPKYPGGPGAMYRFIREQIVYPYDAPILKKSEKVRVTVQVNIDGSLSNFRIKHSVGKAFDKEAIRVVKSMPLWSPGEIHGKNVPVKIDIPVTFSPPIR